MKSLIIGNWKCNPKTLVEAERLFNTVKSGLKNVKRVKVVICPPYPYLKIFNFQFSIFNLGGQDCHYEQSGAYTGEVSPKMLKDLGCQYVIIGHSERRKYFKETDEIINKKLKAVLKAGLKAVLCIGEKKGENLKRVINNQLKKDLKRIAKKDLKKIIIAYEPVWAISTSGGGFCSPKQAKKMLDFIKKGLSNTIIYGGSVDSKIVKGYIDVGFDGVLVGGASLNAKEFVKIIKNA